MLRFSGAGVPPIASGGTGFQPVLHTGKMPVPPKTFQDRTDNEDGGQFAPYASTGEYAGATDVRGLLSENRII